MVHSAGKATIAIEEAVTVGDRRDVGRIAEDGCGQCTRIGEYLDLGALFLYVGLASVLAPGTKDFLGAFPRS